MSEQMPDEPRVDFEAVRQMPDEELAGIERANKIIFMTNSSLKRASQDPTIQQQFPLVHQAIEDAIASIQTALGEYPSGPLPVQYELREL